MLRAFSSVEIVHMNRVVQISSSEHMSSITELNFTAALNWNGLTGSQSFRKNVVNDELIWDSDNNMETGRMEGDSKSFFSESFFVLKGLVHVVPDLDGLIFRAGDDQLFSNTGVKTSDFISMELGVDVIKLWSLLCACIKRNVNL
tara:strand:+ start:947 stop:1381 length:435 start_codon:yes stop_codon:yes gene_type:complete